VRRSLLASVGLLALAALAVPTAGQAGDRSPFRRAPLWRGGGVATSTGSLHSPAPTGSLRHDRRPLQDFVAGKRLEARRGIRVGSRDSARALQRTRLGAHPSPGQLEHYREQAQREEARDALSAAVDLEAYERASGLRLGPVTRRVLEESRIRFQLDQRLNEIDRTVEARTPDAATPPDFGPAPGGPLER